MKIISTPEYFVKQCHYEKVSRSQRVLKCVQENNVIKETQI